MEARLSAIEILQQELEKRRAEIHILEHALSVLTGGDERATDSSSSARDFKGLRIVDATERLLAEKGQSKGTKEIANELLRRGLQTTSKKWVATVYATLDNSGRFNRLGKGRHGRWVLKSEGGAQ